MFNKKNINNYIICIGCNYNGSLSGCVNDSIAMYNTFSRLKNEEIYILNDDTEIVTTDKIRKIVNEIHNKSEHAPYRIIFTFAGHGHNGGKIQLSNKIVSSSDLYQLINDGSKRLFELLLILDSCYSGGFINLKTYKNICDITVITSCSSSQKSSESMSQKLKNKEYILPYKTKKKDSYYIGVFTYNFTSIIEDLIKKEKEITLDNIFNNEIWCIVSKIASQTYQIK
jgi:hypothetical protein